MRFTILFTLSCAFLIVKAVEPLLSLTALPAVLFCSKMIKLLRKMFLFLMMLAMGGSNKSIPLL
jgi:hypothetical protein